MFIECEEQETGPAHQQTEVLQEKHETWSVCLHTIHLWKLKKGKKSIMNSFDGNVWLFCIFAQKKIMKKTKTNNLAVHLSVLNNFSTLSMALVAQIYKSPPLWALFIGCGFCRSILALSGTM